MEFRTIPEDASNLKEVATGPGSSESSSPSVPDEHVVAPAQQVREFRTSPEDTSNLKEVATGPGSSESSRFSEPDGHAVTPSRHWELGLNVMLPALWVVVVAGLGVYVLGRQVVLWLLPDNGFWRIFPGVILAEVVFGLPLVWLATDIRRWRSLQAFCDLRRAYESMQGHEAEDEPFGSQSGRRPQREQIDPLLEHWRASGSRQLREAVQEVETDLRSHDGPAEWRGLIEKHILANLDDQTDKEIGTAALTVASANAMIPYRHLGALATMWINFRLTRRILEIYRIRPGLTGMLRVLARALEAVIFGDAGSEVVTQAVGQMHLSWAAPLGKGALAGCLTIRFGRAVCRECRPIPRAAQEEQTVIASLLKAVKEAIMNRWADHDASAQSINNR